MSLPIPLGIKIGQLFIVTLFFVGIFAKVYYNIFKRSFKDAVNNSIRVQTLTGGSIVVDSDMENFVISAQTVLAYLITSGLIIVSINI